MATSLIIGTLARRALFRGFGGGLRGGGRITGGDLGIQVEVNTRRERVTDLQSYIGLRQHVSERAFAQEMARTFRTWLIPELQSRLPRRTGEARRLAPGRATRRNARCHPDRLVLAFPNHRRATTRCVDRGLVAPQPALDSHTHPPGNQECAAMKFRLPWVRERGVEDRSYADAITSALLSLAEGDSTIKATATAALEAAAGFVGRSFASAEVKADPVIAAALPPATLANMGRSLIQYGESLWLIRTDGGRLRLAPAQSWDVYGDPDPETWRYRVTIAGASTLQTYNDVPAAAVVHVQYAFDPREPWRGVSPLAQARLAGRLSAQLSAALGDEASGPRGSFLPVPVDGQDPTIAQMKADARNAKGAMLFTESGDWDAAGGGRYAGWNQQRFGAMVPDALVNLHKLASMEVLAACGIAMSLFDQSDGTSKREAYRQALHATVAPLGRIVARELSDKLEDVIALDWAELRAGDIAGRARAFQSMTGAGMDPAKAAALSGLMVED